MDLYHKTCSRESILMNGFVYTTVTFVAKMVHCTVLMQYIPYYLPSHIALLGRVQCKAVRRRKSNVLVHDY